MSIGETGIQKKEIVPFFCLAESEGGLGYRETAPNIVSEDLFIPSQLAEFVKKSSPDVWKRLLRGHSGNEAELTTALKDAVKDRLLESNNAASFFKKATMTFENETVPLFHVSGTELSGDGDFKKNIFAAVAEMPHKIVCEGVVIQSVRPDISFFLNGIFIGYLELKSVINGQSAGHEGRGKIIGDYLESVKGIANQAKRSPTALECRRGALALFEKGIHLVTTDVGETFVLRNVSAFYDEAFRGFTDGTLSISQMRSVIEKQFKPYPVTSELLTDKQRFTEVMTALYSKKMVEREILYYNFIQYKYKGKANKKKRTTNKGSLISPRPKQKFGCDKIITRVREMLEHEKEPDFYRNRLKSQLEALGVIPERVEEILADRDKYCNNKYVYSLLMQYAAGFGKSNIIGWTALQLKDLRHEGAWAFDKIMIVVDRLQLRDQIDTMMMSMNIEKAMFTEVTNQTEFVKALTDNKRIVVVNIQKFLELQNALDKAGKTLEKMRVAFLIDEIHRSNTGDSNKEMINLFEKLQDGINGTATSEGGQVLKKNLIVGFTATPTEKVLARFGEFKSASIIPTWVPFDCYTMKEAIEDGYILDPTKHIIKVVTKLDFDVPEDYDPNDENQTINIDKSQIYGNESRMEKLASFIVTRLVSLVYGKIRGNGKAMLAVTSIPIAIKYCNLIRRMMAAKCEEPNYVRYKDAPVCIVYSDNQECESSSSMNDGKTESQVIELFKNAKNGLIIVVDKLQTGFDEPKLHTLFLDKEIQDINAIQTISRVNRTCKYKEECHIVDLSWRNVNIENISAAFKKFCGMNTSSFNPDQEALVVKMLYEQLSHSEPFKRWFQRFRRQRGEAAFCLEMEEGIRRWITEQFEKTAEVKDAPAGTEPEQAVNQAKELRTTVGKYGISVESLEGVLDIDAKYTDPVFLDFWLRYCNVFRIFLRDWNGNGTSITPIVDTGDEIPGITIAPGEDPEDEDDEDDEDEDDSGKEKRRQDILAIIRRWNAEEQLEFDEVKKWLEEVGKLFTWLLGQEEFMAVIQDNTFSPEVKFAAYNKRVMIYKILLRQRDDFEKVQLFKKMLDDNSQQLLDVFVQGLPGVLAEEYDFDFGEGGQASPEILHDIGEARKFKGYLPVYSAKAACGKFGEDEVVDELGWIAASGVGVTDNTMFVVQARGHSMEPQIKDGDYCVFRKPGGGSFEDKVVLVQHSGHEDADYSGAFTIKKLTHRDGKVVLVPKNKDYEPFEISDDAEYGTGFKVVGEFWAVLRRA